MNKCRYLRVKKHMASSDTLECIMGHPTSEVKCYDKERHPDRSCEYHRPSSKKAIT